MYLLGMEADPTNIASVHLVALTPERVLNWLEKHANIAIPTLVGQSALSVVSGEMNY